MAPEDPLDEFWDELHPPRRTHPFAGELVPFPKGAAVDPIKEIDDLDLTAEAHLVLAWTWLDLGKALDRLRVKTHPRATIDTLTSHLPCMLLGNDHWVNIQKGLDDLLASERQAFIGTMNTFVIDCFYFTSAVDVQRRILFVAPISARLFRMNDDAADRFYQSYNTGISHVSEIIRIAGLW